MMETISQIAIPLFSGLGVFFINRKDNLIKYGSLFGLLGQPFWHYTTYSNEQWGLFYLSFFFTLQWSKGFYHHWIKKDVTGLSQTVPTSSITAKSQKEQPKVLKALKQVRSPTGDLTLTELLEKQKELDGRIRPLYIARHKKPEWTLKYTRALNHELMELEDWLPWKFWSKKHSSKEVDELELKYELIDIMHFLLSMFIIWDMTAEEISTLYLTKHNENIRRQNDGY